MSQDHFRFSVLAAMADVYNQFVMLCVTLFVDLIEEGTFVVGLAF